MSDKTFKVGFIGAGFISEWHAKALRGVTGAELVAVCDHDAFRAKALADTFGIAKSYGSMDEMFAEGHGLDAVHVLLPPHLHFPAIKQALQAGVHVFTEKPMAVSAAECDELVALAAETGKRVGVGHNFLFMPVYERLMDDMRTGRLGVIDHVRVTWAKELKQFSFGPFAHWMFAEPGNLMLEIGPHSMAHLRHLAQLCGEVNGERGELDTVETTVGKGVDLPGGKRAYRRWQTRATAGSTAIDVEFSFVPGFDEHQLHVRGSLGNATVDLDRNTYVVEQHTPREIDFDRYAVLKGTGKAIIRQGRANLLDYFKAKAKLSKAGNTFLASIMTGQQSFYAGLRSGTMDPRLDEAMGGGVVALCERVGEAANEAAARDGAAASGGAGESLVIAGPGDALRPAETLVLGGSGFIGRALVRKLAEAGKTVRVVSRSPFDLGLGELAERVQIVRGDMRKPEDLDRLLQGIDCVFHLARANGKTWQQWYEEDVLATKGVAEKCLEHGVRRLIYTSTIAALDRGRAGVTITDDTPTEDPDVLREVYARTKAQNEKVLRGFHEQQGLDVVIFRPGIVLGPGGPPLHSGIASWSYNRVAQLWGDGKSKLPIVLVDDVADALVAGMTAEGVSGGAFNLVADPVLDAREYLGELERYCRIKFEVLPKAIWRYYGFELFKWAVKMAVRHPERRFPRYSEWRSRSHVSPFDCSKTRKLLGWNPVSDRAAVIEQGIHRPADEFILGAACVQRESAETPGVAGSVDGSASARVAG